MSSNRRAWRDDPALLKLAEGQRGKRRDKGLPAPEAQRLLTHPTQQVSLVVHWVVDHVAAQPDLTVEERLKLGRFLLDHGPKRLAGMAAVAPYAKQLVVWAVKRKTDPSGVNLLSPETLPRFLADARSHYSVATYNQCRRQLLNLAEDLYPDGDFSDVPPGAARAPMPALGEHQFGDQWQQACQLDDMALRLTVLAILCLARGCGMESTDIGVCQTDDVYVEARHHVLVRRADAEPAAVLQRFARPLLYVVRQTERGPLVRVGRTTKNVTGDLRLALRRHGWDPGVPFFSVANLASAYRLEMGARKIALAKLKAMLGGVTLRSMDHHLAGFPLDALDGYGDIFGEEQLPIYLYTPEITE